MGEGAAKGQVRTLTPHLPHLLGAQGPVLGEGPSTHPLVVDTHVLTSVTGGYDPLIRLWNPFFSKKPVWMMKGHQTSVTHILVNSKNSSILLSISKDKVLLSGAGLSHSHWLLFPAEALAPG